MPEKTLDIYSMLIFAILIVSISSVLTIEREKKAKLTSTANSEIQAQEVVDAEYKRDLQRKREAIFAETKAKAWSDVLTTDELMIKIVAHGYVFAILLLALPIAVIVLLTNRQHPRPGSNKEFHHE